MHTTLVSPEQLAAHLDDPAWAVVDCRFSLQDTERGRQAYLAGHIPGAVYAHLDEDLSGPVVPGRTGRHPLPDPAHFVARLERWGVGDATQVVAYDDAGGAFAARLWWMLRWIGHEAAAVLDGGWQAWLAAGLPTRSGAEARPPARLTPRLRPELAVTAAEVDARRGNPAWRVLDARGADRFRGENETIDPVAGHIPGARSAPYADNLTPDGRFRDVESLRLRYQALLGDVAADRAICYCGSGVTAAHNLLAMLHAGLGEGRLYPGSWSEWIADPARPVAVGPE
ncbi:MAG: sulfurtransferase [Caldilineales bacterium]|nr:sulfurtransferase [Caldilineales bacterium]MDW8317899.1 sulfurtransferase [Anaerolineae bacterium]